MARLEGEATIAAGPSSMDPVFQPEPVGKEVFHDDSNIILGRFVELMRRKRGLSIEALAGEIDVELSELVEIEEDVRHVPDHRSIYQLANYFAVPMGKLMKISGLSKPRDPQLSEAGFRFAARSESVEELSPEEQEALETFVAILTESK
jgi:transcriptional regulator with XRE-family HTH domain